MEDGSSDRTPEICRRYASEHPGLVRYYHRDGGGGKPPALNFGAGRASGDIIAVYDADTEIPDSGLLGRMVAHPGREIPWPNVDWDGSKWRDIPGTGAYRGATYET